MFRPRPLSLAAFALVGVPIVLTAACSTPEQDLLTKYFQAAKLRDNMTVSNIATVNFSPTEDGIVQSFSMVKTGEEQRRPLKLKELAAAEEEARKADEEFNKQKKAYQDGNIQAIERVLKVESAGKTATGADAAVQAAWTKWRDDTKQYSQKLAEARRALSTERRLAESSLTDPRSPVDPTQFDGDLVTKDVVVKANVKKGDAAPQERELYVRMTKADLKNGPGGKAVNGRWIITHVGEAAPGPPTE